MWTSIRKMLEAEGTVSAKALGWECAGGGVMMWQGGQCGWGEGDGRGGGRGGQGPTLRGIAGWVFGFYSKPWEAARGFYAEERFPSGRVWETDRGDRKEVGDRRGGTCRLWLPPGESAEEEWVGGVFVPGLGGVGQ